VVARAGQVRQHERARKLKWLAKPSAPASGRASIDKIGVISFDEHFQLGIPMGPAGNLEDKSNLIGQITANGAPRFIRL